MMRFRGRLTTRFTTGSNVDRPRECAPGGAVVDLGQYPTKGYTMNGATWTIYLMEPEDSTGDLYAVERDGLHIISRVTGYSARQFVRDNVADADKVQYKGGEWTAAKWRTDFAPLLPREAGDQAQT